MLENLPNELKLAIFDHLPDMNTLSALVHASPIFHGVYFTHRQRIFTKATLRLLHSQIVGRTGYPALWVFNIRGPELKPDLIRAFRSLVAQAHDRRNLRLTIEQCLALQTVRWIYCYIYQKYESKYRSWPNIP